MTFYTVHPSIYDTANECHRWQRGQGCMSKQYAPCRPKKCWRIHRPPAKYEGQTPPWRPKSSAPPPPGAPPSSWSSGSPPWPSSSSGSASTGPPPPPSGSASTGSAPTVPTVKAAPPMPGSLYLRDVIQGIILNTPIDERQSRAQTFLFKFHPDRNLDVELQAFFKPTVLFLTNAANSPWAPWSGVNRMTF